MDFIKKIQNLPPLHRKLILYTIIILITITFSVWQLIWIKKTLEKNPLNKIFDDLKIQRLKKEIDSQINSLPANEENLKQVQNTAQQIFKNINKEKESK